MNNYDHIIQGGKTSIISVIYSSCCCRCVYWKCGSCLLPDGKECWDGISEWLDKEVDDE